MRMVEELFVHLYIIYIRWGREECYRFSNSCALIFLYIMECYWFSNSCTLFFLHIMQVSRRLSHCASTKQNSLTSFPRPGSVCRVDISSIFQFVFQIGWNVTWPLWSSSHCALRHFRTPLRGTDCWACARTVPSWERPLLVRRMRMCTCVLQNVEWVGLALARGPQTSGRR